MKILLVNRALGTLFGGGEAFDFNAARQLAARGHEVTLVTGKPWFGSPVRQYPELRVEYVPTPNLRRYAYATERWNRVLSAACYHGDNALFEQAVLSWYRRQPRGTFDLVQCCSLFALPERLLACYGQPVVSWLPGPPSGRVRRRLPGLLAQPHFGLFTHGATEWELNRLGYEAGRDFAIIEPGIDLEAADRNSGGREPLRARLGLGHQDLLGVTTARLVPIKNHDLLFRALAAAKAQGVIWHWLLLGDGPLDAELKQQAQALGLSSQVHFLGYQSQEEVHGWLSAADLFGLTSRYESYSIATLEAMAHHLPVVGTRVGYLEHLISSAGAGRVVPLDAPSLLAQILVELASLPLRHHLGQQGRRFAETLSWATIAAKLEVFYGNILGGKGLLP